MNDSLEGCGVRHCVCTVPCCAVLCCRGPLGWLVPAEVQPLETRAAGTGINT